MFIGGIGLQRPHSPVPGGILGNVVFCRNMAATCSTYNGKDRSTVRDCVHDKSKGRVQEAEDSEKPESAKSPEYCAHDDEG